jgi:hypothetical protein
MKREKIRQVFKQRFEDFDADNNCVTTFVISKDRGLWCVILKCSIEITHTIYSPTRWYCTSTILYDIEDRCEWVGDFFDCTVNVSARESYISITFHPLNDIN